MESVIFMSALLSTVFVSYILIVYLFHPKHPLTILKDFVREDWKYILAGLAVASLTNVFSSFRVNQDFTFYIYALEGSTVEIFQAYTPTSLTVFFSIIYLIGYPSLLVYTFHMLKTTDNIEAEKYVFSFATLVLLAGPFFYLLPVKVTSNYIDMEPLLYTFHPIIEAGITSVDTLRKAFPSLHTGQSVLASLYASKVSRKFAIASWTVTTLVMISTFYLGIHWITDAVAGSILAYIAYRTAEIDEVKQMLSNIKTHEFVRMPRIAANKIMAARP